MAMIKLARSDWDITVIMPRSSPAELVNIVEGLGAKVDHIDSALDLKPAGSIRRKLIRQKTRIATEIESFRKLRGFDFKSVVFHIDFAPWQSWILYSLLAARGAKVFVTMHNFFAKQPQWREFVFRSRLQVLSRLSGFHIFASNKDTRNKLKGWVSSEFWSNIPVTYTCVDRVAVDTIEREGADRGAARKKFDIPSDKFIVLTVGQFVDRKGRWVLLDAARNAARIDKEIVFVWVMPTLPDVEDAERIRSFGLEENFQPVLSKSLGDDRLDVLRFFKTADMFALPSYIEGLPIAILEAMALGLPTVSTRVYAIPEAVKHEETGLLVDAGDSDGLCRAILRLKNDRALATRLADAGREFVLKNFDERDASAIAIRAFEESLSS